MGATHTWTFRATGSFEPEAKQGQAGPDMSVPPPPALGHGTVSIETAVSRSHVTLKDTQTDGQTDAALGRALPASTSPSLSLTVDTVRPTSPKQGQS